MKENRQVLLGFLAGLLSVVVILGSLSISLSESGVKLAMQIISTRTRGPRLATITSTYKPPTNIPGKPTFTPLFSSSLTPSLTQMISLTLLPFPTNCIPPKDWIRIEVLSGDSLESIAEQYNTSVEELMVANCLTINDLKPGSKIYVPELPPTELPPTESCVPPQGWVLYTVRAGDTLYQIGVMYGVSVAELQRANCMGYSTLILAGKSIYVPNIMPRTRTPSPTHLVPTTRTATSSPTDNPTLTSVPQLTSTLTPSSTSTPAPPSRTPSFTPSITQTSGAPSPTDTATLIPTSTATPTPSSTASPTNTPLPTSTPTSSPTPTPSGQPSAIFTNTPSIIPQPPTSTASH